MSAAVVSLGFERVRCTDPAAPLTGGARLDQQLDEFCGRNVLLLEHGKESNARGQKWIAGIVAGGIRCGGDRAVRPNRAPYVLLTRVLGERNMVRGLGLWLLGVPVGVIILIALFTNFI